MKWYSSTIELRCFGWQSKYFWKKKNQNDIYYQCKYGKRECKYSDVVQKTIILVYMYSCSKNVKIYACTTCLLTTSSGILVPVNGWLISPTINASRTKPRAAPSCKLWKLGIKLPNLHVERELNGKTIKESGNSESNYQTCM